MSQFDWEKIHFTGEETDSTAIESLQFDDCRKESTERGRGLYIDAADTWGA